jgi:O-antigen ligase
MHRLAAPRPFAFSPPAVRRDEAAWRAGVEDVCLILLLLTCFGTVVGLYSKVNLLREAPGWAVALYLGPIAWGAAMCAVAPVKALRTALLGGPLLLFVLWAGLSSQWSHQPALSLRQGILYACTYMVACALAFRLPWWRIGRVLGGVFAIQALLSALLATLKPEWGVMSEIYPGAWSGLWSFKQTLGIAMMMGLAVVVGHAVADPRARVWCVPAAVLMLICVVRSEATTAVLASALVVGAAGAIWFAQRHPSAAVFTLWAVTTVAVLGAAGMTFMADLLFSALGKAPTLTGRTDIWAALAPAVQERATMGWGFQAFWTDRTMTSPVDVIERAMEGFRPPDAHSTPLDIRLQLGWIGLALAAAAFARAWWQAVALSARDPAMMMATPMLVAVTTVCFTETMALYPMDFATLVVMLVMVKLALTVADRRDAARGSVEAA